MIYDGRGGEPFRGDVAIDGDRIAAVGTVTEKGRTEVDAHGLAVAPGFINIMAWNRYAVPGLRQDLIRLMVTHDPRYVEHADRTIDLFDGHLLASDDGRRQMESVS